MAILLNYQDTYEKLVSQDEKFLRKRFSLSLFLISSILYFEKNKTNQEFIY